MTEAVLLDFDGLLADTERIHCRTWCAVLAEQGLEVSDEEYGDHWIRQGLGIAEFVAARGLPWSADALLTRKKALHLAALATDLRPMPGALDFVARLRARTRLVLVTSSRRATVEPAIDLLGLAPAFEAVITYESAPRRKPHPDPMLVAARSIGVAPERCVAIDDAEKGVLSAAAAGMAAVAVPNEHTRDNDFSRAALVVSSLAELSWERLAGLSRAG